LVNEMAESKGKKRRSALIIAIVLLGVVTTAVFGYVVFVNPAQHETIPYRTTEAEMTDAAVDSIEDPPNETMPPTAIPTKQPTPTVTNIPTHTPTNTTALRTTISITPELFIYHTP
jgi:flagellar basal body-associated protein FliL